MSCDSRVLDLVVTWEELRSAGVEVSAESLCSRCPELLEELRTCLAAMTGMDAVLHCPTLSPVSPLTAEEPLPATAWPVIPGYEIVEELGRGGMGIVFKARHLPLERTVALKTILAWGVIDEEQVRRFLQEAKAMARLQHPNIVQIYEIGQQGDNPFLAMEYVAGANLSTVLGGKPWPARKAAELVESLARAIHLAHEQGVLHRDLKPTNILLNTEGVPKICDFGLAKHLEDDLEHTRTDQLLGTPSYMAPEQVQHTAGSQSPAVDIHALGVVLYETLTGRPPYLADNPLDTLQLVLHQDPLPPRRLQPKIPRDLETVCLKCLAKAPQQRYASAAELADDLRRFLTYQRVHARPIGLRGRCQRWCRAHPSRAMLLAAASMALILTLGVTLTYNRRLAQELARSDTVHRQLCSTQEQLHHTLIRAVADHIDGDLRQLASVPQTMAALLEHRRDWDEPLLEQSLKDILDKAPLVYGMCVAFEPYQWRAEQQDFAFYVYRDGQEIAVKRLVPPDYRPVYREWHWYRVAAESPQGRWSEPYVDTGGGQVPMVTFSAPIHRDGRLVGVVTADLAGDYFRDLHESLAQLDWGPGGSCFLVSADARLLVHPLERYEFPSADSTCAGFRWSPVFATSCAAGARSPRARPKPSISRPAARPPSPSAVCRPPTGSWSP